MGRKLLEECYNYANIERETGNIAYNGTKGFIIPKRNEEGKEIVEVDLGNLGVITLDCDKMYSKYYPSEYLKRKIEQGKENIVKINDLAGYLHKCWCEKEIEHYNLPKIFKKGTIQATVYKDRKKYSVIFKNVDEVVRELQTHKEVLAICLMEENLPIADRYRGVKISFGEENRNPKEALEIIKEKINIIKEEENAILKEKIKTVPKKHLRGIYAPTIEEWNDELEYNVYLESEINALKLSYFKERKR